MNFMSVYEDYPLCIKEGFYIFLQSERKRHLKDIEDIDGMLMELEEETPILKNPAKQEMLKQFAERFVDF